MLFSYYLCLPITLALSTLHFVSPLCEFSRPEFCMSPNSVLYLPAFSRNFLCLFVLIAAFCRTSFSCSCFVRFDLRMIWCCVRPEDKHFEIRLFDLINFGCLFDLRNCWCVRSMSCVWSCVRRERFWSCVRPEKDFFRVFDLTKILVVCSIWECFWSCVRPKHDFGPVFDLRKISSCVRPENGFGRVCDLRRILVVCSTWSRFLVVSSTWEWFFNRVLDLRMKFWSSVHP